MKIELTTSRLTKSAPGSQVTETPGGASAATCGSWGHRLQPFLAALVLCAATLSAAAQVLSPSSPVLGRTYGDWTEAWWQWCYSLPASHHPLFDSADVSAGQKGKVWFLGGNFTGAPEVRNIVIPADKLLFFPILNSAIDDTDCANGQRISDGLTAAQLRSLLKPSQDAAQNLSCTIDGTPVAGLADATSSPFRAQTASPNGFSYSLPGMDNLVVLFGYPCWSNSTGAPIRVEAKSYHPVGDGYYIMVAPLAPGDHTIHFHGEIPTVGAVQDVTYNITVSADDSE